MHAFDIVEPSEDVTAVESTAIKYTHRARPQHGEGPMSNHESARTYAELDAEKTGNSARDEGCSFRRLMRGAGHNDQFPWRGPNNEY